MNRVWSYLRDHPLGWLLLAFPLTFLAEAMHWSSSLLLLLSALSLVPLAGYIGEATEALTAYTGPRVGGLINATLGNAAELIITIVAIRAGLLELVKASITGSILGNLLLVLGMAMVLGGLRHGVQRFDRQQASNNAILLALAVIAILVPSVMSPSVGGPESPRVEALSLGVAVVMILLYVLGVVYSLRRPGVTEAALAPQVEIGWSVRTSLVVLALATVGVSVMSEILVGAVEPVVAQWGISEFFLGVVLIPIVGNVAEHLVAVEVALDNHMDLSVEIAVASSLQIALFVAPVLVFVSLLVGNPLQLIFNTAELLAMGAAAVVVYMVSMDGESHWLEGAALLAVYLIFGWAFFLL